MLKLKGSQHKTEAQREQLERWCNGQLTAADHRSAVEDSQSGAVDGHSAAADGQQTSLQSSELTKQADKEDESLFPTDSDASGENLRWLDKIMYGTWISDADTGYVQLLYTFLNENVPGKY